MEDQKRPDSETIDSVDIDYENIDVARIMTQIQKIVAGQPKRAAERGLQPQEPGQSHELHPYAELVPGAAPAGFKQKIKAKALKMMAPFFPVIRLLALPLHEELKAVIQELHKTNQRIDAIDQKLAERDKGQEYIKLLHTLSHNLVMELTKLRIEEDALKSKVRVLEKDLEFLTKRERALEKQIVK
jgi:hypothetical protein